MALWSEMSAAFSSRYEALVRQDEEHASIRAVSAEIRAVARWMHCVEHLPAPAIIELLEREARLAETSR
jgi:hypothetical protein